MDKVCEHVKEYCKASGAQFVLHTRPAKKAKDSDPIDDVVYTSDTHIIKFQATNEDHKYLLQTEHNINTLTGGLFEKKNKDEEPEVKDEEEETKVKVKTIYQDDESEELGSVIEQGKDFEELYVPEVIANDKIHFFRVPKLGSMYALKFTLKSCLTVKAIDDAIADQKSLNEKRLHIDELKRN